MNNTTTVSGVNTSEALAHWNDTLLRWCATVEHWCRMAAPDRPWGHPAGANAGLIASAALASGHAALVGSGPAGWQGMASADVWVRFATGEVQGDEVVKLELSSITGAAVDFSGFTRAEADALAMDGPGIAKIGACLFVVNDAGDREYFNVLVESVAEKTSADALAWVFPASVRDTPREDGLFSPGVILALKAVG